MASSWSIINAPKATSVAIGGLQAAIAAAIPGEVITVSSAGAATNLTLSTIAKGGYGVCVSLPETQVLRADLADTSGLHFFGGTWAADTVLGNTNASNYGANINSGCSKLSWHGALFDQNATGIYGTCADLWVEGCKFSVQRGDHMQIITSSRVAIEDNAMLAGAKAETFCYFSSGAAPTEGGSSAACTGAGGTWEDTAHADTVQARNGCADLTFARNTVATYGAQGVVTFGADYAASLITRALVAENSFADVSSWAINAAGTDIDIRDNAVAASPAVFIAPRISATRDGSGRVQGGRNTAPAFINPSGVDLSAGTINGDGGVVAPDRPAIILPPWRPATPVPPSPATNLPPAFVQGEGGIRPGSGVTVGTWVSINRGRWTGAAGATWEFRWKRGGTLIGGATAQVYQAQAGDAGTTLTAEVRGTNAYGAGAWTQVGGGVAVA